jgi:micrococcal nuclease
MKKGILECALIALAVLYLGAAMVQGAAESGVAITAANFEAASPEKENLNGEWVEISNLGTSDVSLAGWSLEDGQNHTYSFPEINLAAGASVKVHSGSGTDTAKDLFWNRSSAVWNNDGDTATLKDAAGNVVSRYPEEAEAA